MGFPGFATVVGAEVDSSLLGEGVGGLAASVGVSIGARVASGGGRPSSSIVLYNITSETA